MIFKSEIDNKLDELLQKSSEETGVSIKEMRGSNKQDLFCVARGYFIYLATKLGIKRTPISKALNCNYTTPRYYNENVIGAPGHPVTRFIEKGILPPRRKKRK